MDPERRASERRKYWGAVGGAVTVFEPVVICELSRGGMLIETGFPLQLDSLHDFRLTLGDRSVVVKGRVVHASLSDVDQDIVTYRMGVEFIEPSRHAAAALADFIDAGPEAP